MELPVQKLLFLSGICSLIALATRVTYAQNRVLLLDGIGNYAQFPSNAFKDFYESTVESWIK